ncbi:hypothetical protein GCM10027278_24110 [Paralcaligenes ginsengisoli]
MDEVDLKILELVQQDGRISQSGLGEQVHLSTAAVNRRLRRLQQEGVIRKLAAVLSGPAHATPPKTSHERGWRPRQGERA